MNAEYVMVMAQLIGVSGINIMFVLKMIALTVMVQLVEQQVVAMMVVVEGILIIKLKYNPF